MAGTFDPNQAQNLVEVRPRFYLFPPTKTRNFSPLAARPLAPLRRRLRNSASYCLCLRSRLLITVRFGVYQVRGKSRRARTGTPRLPSSDTLFGPSIPY